MKGVPKHLCQRARRFYRGVTEAFELESHHLEVLLEAANALDRAERARAQIALDGVTYEDRFGQLKAHPLLPTERDARAAFARLVRELGLDVVGAGPNGRPAGR